MHHRFHFLHSRRSRLSVSRSRDTNHVSQDKEGNESGDASPHSEGVTPTDHATIDLTGQKFEIAKGIR
jgi:hypothetical protein